MSYSSKAIYINIFAWSITLFIIFGTFVTSSSRVSHSFLFIPSLTIYFRLVYIFTVLVVVHVLIPCPVFVRVCLVRCSNSLLSCFSFSLPPSTCYRFFSPSYSLPRSLSIFLLHHFLLIFVPKTFQTRAYAYHAHTNIENFDLWKQLSLPFTRSISKYSLKSQ